MFLLGKVKNKVEDMIFDQIVKYGYNEMEFEIEGGVESDADVNWAYYTLKGIVNFIRKHDPKSRKKLSKLIQYQPLPVFSFLDGSTFCVDQTFISFKKRLDKGRLVVGTVHICGLNSHKITNLFRHFKEHRVSLSCRPRNDELILISHPAVKQFSGKLGTSHFSRYTDTVPDEMSVYGKPIHSVLDTVDKFIHMRSKYVEFKVPYSLKMMLYGKPGTGKSTVALLIAKKYGMDIIVVDSKTDFSAFSERILSETARRRLDKDNSLRIVLIEELDVILEKGLDVDVFMSFLNGVGEAENVIILMTTNHIDRIDKRIKRDRRIDYIFELKMLTQEEALPIGKRFGLSNEECEECLKLYDEKYHVDLCSLARYIPASIEKIAMHRALAKLREEISND